MSIVLLGSLGESLVEVRGEILEELQEDSVGEL
jgi:hypothetical protein